MIAEESRERFAKLLNVGGRIRSCNKGFVDDFEGLSSFVVFFCVFFLLVGSFLVAFSGVGRLLIEIFVAHKHFFRLHFKK